MSQSVSNYETADRQFFFFFFFFEKLVIRRFNLKKNFCLTFLILLMRQKTFNNALQHLTKLYNTLLSKKNLAILQYSKTNKII